MKKYKDYTLISTYETSSGTFYKYRIDFEDGTWVIIEFTITDQANREFTYKDEQHTAQATSAGPIKDIIEWICETIEEWVTDDDLPY